MDSLAAAALRYVIFPLLLGYIIHRTIHESTGFLAVRLIGPSATFKRFVNSYADFMFDFYRFCSFWTIGFIALIIAGVIS